MLQKTQQLYRSNNLGRMFNTDIDNDESIFNGTDLSEADNLDLGDNEDVTGQQDEDNDPCH